MANLTYEVDATTLSKAVKHFHAKTLDFLGTGTASGFVLHDTSGMQVIFAGSGLHYSGNSFANGGLTGGTITGFELRDAAGVLLYTATGLHLIASGFSGQVLAGNANSALSFLAGDDVVTGTSGMDLLAAGRGDDVLRGNGAHDILLGGTGSDTMYGGAGPDQFYFQPKDRGRDHVMDFTDTGGKQDDQLIITHAMQDQMQQKQVTAGVELTFGHEHVVIHGWTLALIDADDFILNG